MIDYFSCNPSRKANVQCGRYTIHDIVPPIADSFQKIPSGRTAGASNRDPMCKMALSYVTYGQIYSNSRDAVFFQFLLPRVRFRSFEAGREIIRALEMARRLDRETRLEHDQHP